MKININYIEGKGWEAEMSHGGIRITHESVYFDCMLDWVRENVELLRKKGNTVNEVCQVIINKGENLTPEELIDILKSYNLYNLKEQ